VVELPAKSVFAKFTLARSQSCHGFRCKQERSRQSTLEPSESNGPDPHAVIYSIKITYFHPISINLHQRRQLFWEQEGREFESDRPDQSIHQPDCASCQRHAPSIIIVAVCGRRHRLLSRNDASRWSSNGTNSIPWANSVLLMSFLSLCILFKGIDNYIIER